MNFDKSKVLLKKINAIHDGVADGGGTFSTLEKDLILEYIRDLYECIQLDEEIAPTSSIPTSTIATEPVKVTAPEVIPPPVATANVEQSSSNGHIATSSSNGHHAATTIVEQPNQIVIDMDPDMEELFAEGQLSDLSQRFANAPIQDIAKAMGINERILTINELFKGDQQQFQITADTLNDYTTFAEAKAYLSKGPATKYDWLSSKRKKKAVIFIKLVRRRYL